MNITRETIKSTLRTIMAEETEYQTFFKKALEKAGKSIPSMSDEEKKEFFNKIDAAWDARGEKNEELTGNQHKLDVDGDGEIEASDLAKLRAKKDESINEAKIYKVIFAGNQAKDAKDFFTMIDKSPKIKAMTKDSGVFKVGNEITISFGVSSKQELELI